MRGLKSNVCKGGVSQRREGSFFHRLSDDCGPSDNFFCAVHSVEVASASIGVSTHSSEAKPVSDFSIHRHLDAFGNDVHTIASHTQ